MMFSLQVIFPPQVDPSGIPYRASTLAKRLQVPGHKVRLDDDNQNAYDFFLDPERLRAQLQEAERVLNRLEQQEGNTLSTLQEEYLYYQNGRALLYGSDLPGQVSEAWSVLQSRISTVAQQEKAKQILRCALEVAGLPASPSLVSLHDLNLPYSSESSEDCREAAADDRVNPYVAFWRERMEQIQSERPEAVILWLEVDQQLIPSLTLARLIKEAALSSEVVLAGPFAQFIADRLKSDNPWKEWIDTLADGSDLFSGITVQGQPLLEAGEAIQNLWTVAGLPLNRYLGQPPVVVLPLQEGIHAFDAKGSEETIVELYQRMRRLSESHPKLRFYLASPLLPEWLCELACQMEADGFQPAWGSLVSFGTSLSATQALQLAASGCEFLNFELKGFLGYSDRETAKQQMADSWKNAREAGCRVLLSVVFGHPLSDPQDFQDFVPFLREHRSEVDRLVRLQLFRLTPGTRFWENPESNGISEIGNVDPERDLKRHFPFVSKQGVTSSQLYSLAMEYIVGLKGSEEDLSTITLSLDDWAFRREEQHPVSKESQPVPAEGDEPMFSLSPDVEIRRFAYPFGELEYRWRTFVVGQTPWPEGEPLQKSPACVLYRKGQGKMTVVKGAVFKVLQLCRKPIKETDLLAQFPMGQTKALRALLGKLKAEGVVLADAEAASVTSG